MDEVFVLMFFWYNIKYQDLFLIIYKRMYCVFLYVINILEGLSLCFFFQLRNILFNKIFEIFLLFIFLLDLKCDNFCWGINMYLLKIYRNMICEYV